MKNLKERGYENKKLKYSLRKLSVGVCSVVIGASFFTSNAFATNENLKNDKVNIKYEYVEESALNQAEKSLIVRELQDKKVLKDETYYIVYRNKDMVKSVPDTSDENNDVYKWLMGSAFVVVAVSMKKNRKKTITGVLAISMIGTSVLLTNAYAMDMSKILKTMEYHLNMGDELPKYELDKNLEYVGTFSKSDLMSLTSSNVIADDEQNSEATLNQGETTETTGSNAENTNKTDQDNKEESGDTTSQEDGGQTDENVGSEDQKDGKVNPPSDKEKETQEANTGTSEKDTSENADEKTGENSQSGEETNTQTEEEKQDQTSTDESSSEDTSNQGETTETTGSNAENTDQTDQDNKEQNGDTTSQEDGGQTDENVGSEDQKDGEVNPPSDKEKETQEANTGTSEKDTSENADEKTDENSQSGEETNTQTEEEKQDQTSTDEHNTEDKPNTVEYVTEDNKTHKILWAKGVTPLNMGENGDFKKSTFGQYVEYKAPYKDNMGWYDANKRRDENGSIDATLCFAGVATNMLYWWIDQNRAEIDQYMEYLTEKGYFDNIEKDTIKDIRFLLGEGGKQQDSRIYNMFVLHFFSKKAGYQSDILLDFFINGYKPKENGGTNSEQDDFVLDDRAGFFNEVFGNKKLTSRQFSGNYQSFSNIIKNALSEGSMIGMEHLMTKYTSHIVTLWGAEYDENDKLVAVYVTDTDDQDEANTLGMKRYLVRDVEGRVKISTDEANKSAGAFVEYIHTLKTGKEQWKNFLDGLQ